MSDPKGAFEEIEGRIATLDSQIEYEKDALVNLRERSARVRTTMSRLQALRDEWAYIQSLLAVPHPDYPAPKLRSCEEIHDALDEAGR